MVSPATGGAIPPQVAESLSAPSCTETNGAKIPDVVTRTYGVTNEEVTKSTVGDFRKRHWDRFSVTRVRRDGKVVQLDPDDHVRLGNEVLVLGYADFFAGDLPEPGEEIIDPNYILPIVMWPRPIW